MEPLEDMKLPKASPQEELEQLSKNKFRPLLPISQFEIREEVYRDKGIDLSIEIKYNGNYTGFRFLVQLKSTTTKKKNSDDSYSIQIETSNINYLLNSTLPPIYVLYIKSEDKFYYKWVSHVLDELENSSQKNWKEQASNIIRIVDKLDNAEVSSIYDFVLKKGKFHREINDRLAVRTGLIENGDKIIVDRDLQIHDEAHLKQVLENIGFQLINEGRSHEIIKVVKNLTKSIEESATICLTLGVASYYTGRLMDSINYLSKARKLPNLREDLKDELKYFDLVSKFSLGFIKEDQYNEGITQLEHSGNIGDYIKIGKIKNEFFHNVSPEGYQEFSKKIQNIIQKSGKDTNIQLTARCEDQFVHGTFFNSEFLKSIASINSIESMTGPNLELRAEGVKSFLIGHKKWLDKVRKLEGDIRKDNNIFAYSLNRFYLIKVSYELSAITDIFRVEQDIPGLEMPEFPDQKKEKNEDLIELDKIIERYEYLESYENMTAVLSLKYEILHFIGEFDKASKVLKEMKRALDSTDLDRELLKIEALKDGGTTHERYRDLYERTIVQPQNEFNRIIKELQEIDEEEITKLGEDYRLEEEHHIFNLFPIGYFQIPKTKIETFYELLEIKKPLQNHLDNLLKKIIPIINIKKADIEIEGYVNDHVHIDNIETMQLIFKRRKKLYENGMFRVKIE